MSELENLNTGELCLHYKVCRIKPCHAHCGEYLPKDYFVTDRPHGEWEHWGSPFSDDSIANSIVCSLCKARYVEIEDEVFNFCPNCGAYMREGDENG